MQPYYPVLTLLSIVVFVWLGRRLAAGRHRNRMAWGLAGAALPPLLITLYFMRPLTPEEAGDEADEDDSETAEA